MPALHAPEADLADSKQFREAGSKSVLAEHDADDFVYDLNLLLTERCIGLLGEHVRQYNRGGGHERAGLTGEA